MTRSRLAARFPVSLATLALAALLLASALLAAPRLLPAQNSPAERVESGEVHSPQGNLLHYRIRLLPLASFPVLPAPVLAQLSRRQCMIPQTFEAQQPENVIHGAFRDAGSSDWAALCSSSGSTTLYVFFAGLLDAPLSLRSQPDTAWLGAEPGSSIYGSAWGISSLSLAGLRASPQLLSAATLDHDAIDDAHLEHADTLRYFQAGKWLVLNPPGGN
ncbi:MAG: hypothetical protein WB974_19810 [Acidobacteriaceae bacterium]